MIKDIVNGLLDRPTCDVIDRPQSVGFVLDNKTNIRISYYTQEHGEQCAIEVCINTPNKDWVEERYYIDGIEMHTTIAKLETLYQNKADEIKGRVLREILDENGAMNGDFESIQNSMLVKNVEA